MGNIFITFSLYVLWKFRKCDHWCNISIIIYLLQMVLPRFQHNLCKNYKYYYGTLISGYKIVLYFNHAVLNTTLTVYKLYYLLYGSGFHRQQRKD